MMPILIMPRLEEREEEDSLVLDTAWAGGLVTALSMAAVPIVAVAMAIVLKMAASKGFFMSLE
jgi:hypothetical protein